MEDSKKNKIFIGLMVVFFIIFGFYLLNKTIKNNGVKIEDKIATTTDDHIVLNTDKKNYTITQIPTKNTNQTIVPSLNRKVIFGDSVNLTQEVRMMVTDKIVSLQSELTKDKTNLNNWVSLGLYQKMAGDYEGAVISWKYVGQVANKDFVSFGNLGDLYGYYLHDNGLAETYYKKAIENGPTQSYLYVQLAMLYKDVFSDMMKARAIIEEGLRRIPNNPSLIEVKNRLN